MVSSTGLAASAAASSQAPARSAEAPRACLQAASSSWNCSSPKTTPWLPPRHAHCLPCSPCKLCALLLLLSEAAAEYILAAVCQRLAITRRRYDDAVRRCSAPTYERQEEGKSRVFLHTSRVRTLWACRSASSRRYTTPTSTSWAASAWTSSRTSGAPPCRSAPS